MQKCEPGYNELMTKMTIDWTYPALMTLSDSFCKLSDPDQTAPVIRVYFVCLRVTGHQRINLFIWDYMTIQKLYKLHILFWHLISQFTSLENMGSPCDCELLFWVYVDNWKVHVVWSKGQFDLSQNVSPYRFKILRISKGINF